MAFGTWGFRLSASACLVLLIASMLCMLVCMGTPILARVNRYHLSVESEVGRGSPVSLGLSGPY